MDKIEIEKKASDTLANISYDDTNEAVDVVEVAKKLGFAVGSAGLDEGVDGFIIIQEGQKEILGIKTDKLIGVNAANGLTWKRFTVAHEIGHYMLHYNREQDHGMYAHREHAKGKDETENEADYFAANLLMPREKFKAKYDELKGKGLSEEELTVLLADKFIVTQPMVKRRFEELGIA